MPPDRLLEARKTYAEVTEASRLLSESAAEVEKSIATLGRQVSGVRREMSRLHGEVDEERRRIRDAMDERAEAFTDFRRVLRREWGWMLMFIVCGRILGSVSLPCSGGRLGMAVGGGFELVGRVISHRDTAALRGAGEANGGPMDPWGGPLLGYRAACDGLAQPFEQALQVRHTLPQL